MKSGKTESKIILAIDNILQYMAILNIETFTYNKQFFHRYLKNEAFPLLFLKKLNSYDNMASVTQNPTLK